MIERETIWETEDLGTLSTAKLIRYPNGDYVFEIEGYNKHSVVRVSLDDLYSLQNKIGNTLEEEGINND